MPNPVFLYSIGILHWGYMIHHPGSTAAKPALPIPPPTTVVGSFMNPLARILGIKDWVLKPKRAPGPASSRPMHCALLHTLGAGGIIVSLKSNIGVGVAEEPSRIVGGIYKGSKSGSYRTALASGSILIASGEILPVQGLGYTSAPGAEIILGWLLDKEGLEGCIGESISLRDLERASMSVYRIGSREGIVSTISGGVTVPRVEGPGARFQSLLPQRADLARPISHYVLEVTLSTPSNYNEMLYYVPLSPGSGAVLGGILLSPLTAYDAAVFEATSTASGVAELEVEVESGPLKLSLAYTSRRW